MEDVVVMRQLIFKLAVAVLAFALGLAAFFVWDSFRVLPDKVNTSLNGSPRSDHLSLSLSTSTPSLRVGEEPNVKVAITNKLKSDGSS